MAEDGFFWTQAHADHLRRLVGRFPRVLDRMLPVNTPLPVLRLMFSESAGSWRSSNLNRHFNRSATPLLPLVDKAGKLSVSGCLNQLPLFLSSTCKSSALVKAVILARVRLRIHASG